MVFETETSRHQASTFSKSRIGQSLDFFLGNSYSDLILTGLCSGNDPEHTGKEQEIRCSGTISQTEERSPFRSETKLLFRDRNKRNGTRKKKIWRYRIISVWIFVWISQNLKKKLSKIWNFFAQIQKTNIIFRACTKIIENSVFVSSNTKYQLCVYDFPSFESIFIIYSGLHSEMILLHFKWLKVKAQTFWLQRKLAKLRLNLNFRYFSIILWNGFIDTTIDIKIFNHCFDITIDITWQKGFSIKKCNLFSKNNFHHLVPLFRLRCSGSVWNFAERSYSCCGTAKKNMLFFRPDPERKFSAEQSPGY